MVCPFYHKLCGSCKKYVCRAYFPEKQPYIKSGMMPICVGENYEKECLIYVDAVQWHEERKRKSLLDHCPFAANTFCGKPWLWMCKGAVPPVSLTEVEVDERNLPKLVDGGITYKLGKSITDIKNRCLSGKMEIYEECPYYKEGIEFREYVKRVKKG